MHIKTLCGLLMIIGDIFWSTNGEEHGVHGGGMGWGVSSILTGLT